MARVMRCSLSGRAVPCWAPWSQLLRQVARTGVDVGAMDGPGIG